ncbi:hypothetical protein [Nocardioides speluncae]|uniref:hypothetical protein n=1 Tax=Nocardioides speluncae TaxID=2670337 RepID=UPI000D68927F|nr:hypothetical protein [Nocardioides speluncae]
MKMVLVIALAALLLPLAACGSESTPERSGQEPDDRQTAKSGGEAASWILGKDELPEGWRYATGQQHLGIPELCDVVLEPPHLSSAETQRFTQDAAGPFVIQYSFVSSDEAATAKRMAEWVEAVSTCTTWQADGADIEVTPITDIDAVGEDFAAARGAAAAPAGSGKPPMEREYVAFRNGSQVTVLLAYGLGSLPARTDVNAMAQAIAARA